MSEKAPPSTINPESEIKVRFTTFAEAQQIHRGYSDEFIDRAVENSLQIGESSVGIKGYLDKVKQTAQDSEIVRDPERIADLYSATTQMVARNLKVMVARREGEQNSTRRNEVKEAKEKFLTRLDHEVSSATEKIVDWCVGETREYPVSEAEYHGFKIDGRDILNAQGEGVEDVRPNFKIQRQIGGVFIMGYSDSRVIDKFNREDMELNRRIYLNPEAEATPEIFEDILNAANEAGVSLQLKMLQRSPEMASAHRKNKEEPLRGDGIVIYAEDKDADDVLSMALAIAEDRPQAFKGRETSRVPQNVAEGIAVGDEPETSGYSLTSHRAELIRNTAKIVRESGKKGEEARVLFKRTLAKISKMNNINPRNMAFNL